jgi:hypothetical protein
MKEQAKRDLISYRLSKAKDTLTEVDSALLNNLLV